MEETMNAGHPDIRNAFDGVSEGFTGHSRFFGDGEITGAGTYDGDGSPRLWRWVVGDGEGARQLIELCFREFRANGFHHRGSTPGTKHIALFIAHMLGDSDDLVGCFSFAEDGFGVALTEGAMVVYFCETQIFKGEVLERLERPFRRLLPGSNILQQV